jgi:hypothetical protein
MSSVTGVLDPIAAGRLIHRFRGKVWGYSCQHGNLDPYDVPSDVMIQDSELR